MKIARAILAGIVGAMAMSLAMFLMRLAGLNVNLEGLLGSIAEPVFGLSAWQLGFMLHLVIGGAVALVYAAGFEFAVQRSGVLVGGGFGIAHGLLAGLFMSGIPAMNPLGTGVDSAPGAFLMNVEGGPFLFLLAHLIFGAVLGLVYGPTMQKAHLYTNRPV